MLNNMGQQSAVAPIITHTAATPQDSPSTTARELDREFNNRLLPLCSSSLSIDSIDCSVVRNLLSLIFLNVFFNIM